MRKLFIYMAVLMTMGWATVTGATNMDVLGGITTHGFVSQGFLVSDRYNYLAHDSSTGSFQYNEIGINFSKNLTDKLRIGLQLLSRDLGNIHNNIINVDWAYADYRWRDWLGIRMGMLKIPNGLYNETRDIDMLRTCTLLPLGVYNESFREIYMGLAGIGFYGSIPLSSVGSLDYQLQIGTQSMDADNSGIVKDMENGMNRGIPLAFLGLTLGGSPVAGWVDGDASMSAVFDISSFDIAEMYIASLQWRTPWGLRLGATINTLEFDVSGTYNGASGTTRNFNLDVYQCDNYALSAEYTWQDLILAYEYWHLEYDAKTYLNNFLFDDSTTEKEGWYVSASYRVNSWLELGSYYTVFYPDATDHDGTNVLANYTYPHEAWTKDLALSTRFDVNAYWTVKLEGHKMEGKANLMRAENPGTGWAQEEDFYLFVAKITLSF